MKLPTLPDHTIPFADPLALTLAIHPLSMRSK